MSRLSATLCFAVGLSTACCLGYLAGMFAPRMALLPLEAVFFTLLFFCFLFSRDDHNAPLFTPVAAVTSAAWVAEASRFNVLFLGDIALVMLPIWFLLAVVFFARYNALKKKESS